MITRFLIALGLLAAWRIKADDLSNLLARLKPVPVLPSLAAAARTNGIPLEPIDPPGETGIIAPGDSITALVTLRKKARQTQWLVYLEAARPEPKEESTNKPAPMVLYTSIGNRFEFVSEPLNATVRTLGPFAPGGSGDPDL